jgi:hypothetical protein
MKRLITIVFIFIKLSGFAKEDPFNTRDYVLALKNVTDVMVNDVTSPVAAGRYYAYITLTAQETAMHFQKEARYSFAGKLKEFTNIQADNAAVLQSNYSFAVILSIYKMSERLLPSGYLLVKKQDSLATIARKRGLSLKTIDISKELVNGIVKQIMDYVRQDRFNKLSGLKKYTPLDGDGYWRPTGPGYMAALEPNWNTLRTFILDSCQQFKPLPAAAFDTAAGSSFFMQVKDVYETGKNLTKEQKDIANFWDCNPFALQQLGHIEFGLKKISPGGHWMGITGIVCNKAKRSLQQTAFIHSIAAITLADAFISCWDEKYRSNRIRPETAIKKWVDPYWRPLLQTPPFPEYTSGHSVISTSVATVLTHFFGDNFAFTDNTENEFGLPSRKFKSYLQAASEAAISRFYGGIHYKDAIKNGVLQGKAIGSYVIIKLMLDKI